MTGPSPFESLGGPLPVSSPWLNYGSYVYWRGGVVVGSPAGGNTGNGTVNAQQYYVNGVTFLPFQEAPNDGNSYARNGLTQAWVVVAIATDAPSDGTFYGRLGGAWSNAIDMGTF